MLRDIRLGNPMAWKEIMRKYALHNPHLSLALLASNLPDEKLEEIHDRVKESVQSNDFRSQYD
jgi:hypothetical protein